MVRHEARKIAEKITNQQIQDMLERAKNETLDWTKQAIGNKSFTKATAWNFLGRGFDVDADHHILYKTNIIREFGEFLPDELKPQKKKKPPPDDLIHQQPIFD